MRCKDVEKLPIISVKATKITEEVLEFIVCRCAAAVVNTWSQGAEAALSRTDARKRAGA